MGTLKVLKFVALCLCLFLSPFCFVFLSFFIFSLLPVCRSICVSFSSLSSFLLLCLSRLLLCFSSLTWAILCIFVDLLIGCYLCLLLSHSFLASANPNFSTQSFCETVLSSSAMAPFIFLSLSCCHMSTRPSPSSFDAVCVCPAPLLSSPVVIVRPSTPAAVRSLFGRHSYHSPAAPLSRRHPDFVAVVATDSLTVVRSLRRVYRLCLLHPLPGYSGKFGCFVGRCR